MSILITVILFGCSSIFTLVAFVGIAWLFMTRIKKEQKKHENLKNASLDDFAPEILEWKADALSDFSAELAFDGTVLMGNWHYQGTIKSISEPKTLSWVVFDLQTKIAGLNRRTGTLELRTSEHRYELEIDNKDVPLVRVDGTPFGMIRLRGEKIVLFGIDKRSLGHYHRNLPNRSFSKKRNSFNTAYDPVVIRDRQIAEFNNNLVFRKEKKLLKNPTPSLYRNLATDITPEERDWLMVLLALEIYYRIARYRLMVRNVNSVNNPIF